MQRQTQRPDRAFTLIEILVVIGVIAVVAAIIGVGLGRGSEAANLQAAQRMVMSQFSAARAQAALAGEEVALVMIDDVADPARSRRALALAIDDEGVWRAIADPVQLPGNTGLVVEGDDLWTETLNVAIDPGDQTTSCRAIRFNPAGSLENVGDGEIWLVNGEITSSGWTQNELGLRRGLSISRYGTLQMLEEVHGEQN